MAGKSFLYFVVFIGLSIAIYSCGDSSTSPTTTPAGTVLFSQDSIAIWLSSGGFGTDSFAYSTQNTGGVMLSYVLQSNVDSTHATGRWGMYTNANPPTRFLPNKYGPVDAADSVNLSFLSGQSTYFAMAVQLNVSGGSTPYYVRIKNIKIVKK